MDGYFEPKDLKEEMNLITRQKEDTENKIKELQMIDDSNDNKDNMRLIFNLKELEKQKLKSYYVHKNNLWNQLTKEQQQELIMEFIDSIEVKVYPGANAFAPKPIEITNIIIRLDKISSFAFNFRKRMLELANKEDIDTNKYVEIKEYQRIQEGLKASPFLMSIIH